MKFWRRLLEAVSLALSSTVCCYPLHDTRQVMLMAGCCMKVSDFLNLRAVSILYLGKQREAPEDLVFNLIINHMNDIVRY